MKILKAIFAWMSLNGPFILTFISIAGVLALSILKNADLNLLSTLLGLYLGSTATRTVSAHWAASKDKDADTASVINSLEGIKSVEPTEPPKV